MTTRRHPQDSEPIPLDGPPKRYVRFEPTLNTGHVLQIVVLVVGGFSAYGALKNDQFQQRADLEQVKAVALIERAQTTQALIEIKASVKELQVSTQDVKESLAILRGRAADVGTKK
jgi:hypothetical protein